MVVITAGKSGEAMSRVAVSFAKSALFLGCSFALTITLYTTISYVKSMAYNCMHEQTLALNFPVFNVGACSRKSTYTEGRWWSRM